MTREATTRSVCAVVDCRIATGSVEDKKRPQMPALLVPAIWPAESSYQPARHRVSKELRYEHQPIAAVKDRDCVVKYSARRPLYNCLEMFVG